MTSPFTGNHLRIEVSIPAASHFGAPFDWYDPVEDTDPDPSVKRYSWNQPSKTRRKSRAGPDLNDHWKQCLETNLWVNEARAVVYRSEIDSNMEHHGSHLKLSTPNIAKVWVSAPGSQGWRSYFNFEMEVFRRWGWDGWASKACWKSCGKSSSLPGFAEDVCFFPILEATRNGESTRNRFHFCGPVVANPRSSFKIQEIETRATTWLRNSTERDNIESNQRTRWEFQTFMCFQPWLGWLVEMKIFFWIAGSTTTRKGRYCILPFFNIAAIAMRGMHFRDGKNLEISVCSKGSLLMVEYGTDRDTSLVLIRNPWVDPPWLREDQKKKTSGNFSHGKWPIFYICSWLSLQLKKIAVTNGHFQWLPSGYFT